ncbi:hypothetical protein TUM4261_39460 [Shewanella sp. c952]|uniref:hypothetical protein n=1 Tax=Shewanella sp. c952 TaxID=2815913 RepID=UPI001BBD3AE5|nr:hypothetical protein [Shewanella sp. c952]GIU18526.1 hypothetical protein TUM4261_39460 [Shewanella sp. c952]
MPHEPLTQLQREFMLSEVTEPVIAIAKQVNFAERYYALLEQFPKLPGDFNPNVALDTKIDLVTAFSYPIRYYKGEGGYFMLNKKKFAYPHMRLMIEMRQWVVFNFDLWRDDTRIGGGSYQQLAVAERLSRGDDICWDDWRVQQQPWCYSEAQLQTVLTELFSLFDDLCQAMPEPPGFPQKSFTQLDCKVLLTQIPEPVSTIAKQVNFSERYSALLKQFPKLPGKSSAKVSLEKQIELVSGFPYPIDYDPNFGGSFTLYREDFEYSHMHIKFEIKQKVTFWFNLFRDNNDHSWVGGGNFHELSAAQRLSSGGSMSWEERNVVQQPYCYNETQLQMVLTELFSLFEDMCQAMPEPPKPQITH